MNARTSLQLVAHAATPAMRAGCFPDDDVLDVRALEEAAAARGTLITVAPDAPVVLCSPARCALQTAEALGLNAQVVEALRDTDYGDWRGRRLMDLARDHADALAAWTADPGAAPHGGESFEALMLRVGAWMDGLPLHGHDITAITHAVTIRAAVAHALHARSVTMFHIDVAPLSCIRFARSPDGWKLVLS